MNKNYMESMLWTLKSLYENFGYKTQNVKRVFLDIVLVEKL